MKIAPTDPRKVKRELPQPDQVRAQRDILLRALEAAQPVIEHYDATFGCGNVKKLVQRALYEGQRTGKDAEVRRPHPH
jgi:hypothetical protein